MRCVEQWWEKGAFVMSEETLQTLSENACLQEKISTADFSLSDESKLISKEGKWILEELSFYSSVLTTGQMETLLNDSKAVEAVKDKFALQKDRIAFITAVSEQYPSEFTDAFWQSCMNDAIAAKDADKSLLYPRFETFDPP